MSNTPHLWEIVHDYYGPDSCYYANGYETAKWNQEYGSWAEFADPDSDSLHSIGGDGFSISMNWLYRWDWLRPDPADYKYELEENPDFELPGDTLELFWLFPRKGMISRVEIKVTEADEPAVREWLQRFADYMRDMWAPFDLSPSKEQES
jgi:hypothetical protein